MKTLISLIFFLFLTGTIKSQEWKLYKSNDYLSKIVCSGDYIWGISENGLVRINKLTGNRSYYNEIPHADNVFKCEFFDIAADSIGNIWLLRENSFVYFNPVDDSYKIFPFDDISFKYGSIEIDKDNNMWFSGLHKKLLKYSENRFKTYDVEDIDIAEDGLAIDKNNNVWFSGYNKKNRIAGLYRFDGESFQDYVFDPEIEIDSTVYDSLVFYYPNLNLTSISTDSKNKIWYSFHETNYWMGGIDYYGLYCKDNDKYVKYDTSNSDIPSNRVFNIFCDSKDRVWFYSGSSVCYIENDSLHKLNLKFSEIHSGAFITEDKDGTVWISLPDKIYSFHDNNLSELKTPYASLPKKNISDIIVKDDGTAYMLADYYHRDYNREKIILLELRNNRFNEHLLSDHFHISYDLVGLDIDSHGRIWTASGSTIIMLSNGEFKGWTTYIPAGFGSIGITDIKCNKTETPCITANYSYPSEGLSPGSYNGFGLSTFSNGELTTYMHKNMGGVAPYEIANDGTVWMHIYNHTTYSGIITNDKGDTISRDTFSGTLAKLDNGNLTAYNKLNSALNFNEINNLAIDSSKNVWMSCGILSDTIEYQPIGLVHFDGYYWKIFNSIICDLPSNNITNIIVDRRNRIWLTCKTDLNDQVANYDGIRWTVFDKKTEIIRSDMTEIKIDSKDNIWIGTDSILYKYSLKNGKKECTKYEIPFQDCSVREIYIDSKDNIWIICNHGLVIFNEDQITISVKESMNNSKNLKLSLHPNPFSQSTIINYELREAGYISLELFDMLGNKIATLVDDWQEAGTHSCRFNGEGLTAGVYLVRMMSGEGVVSEKVVYVE